MTYNVFGGSLNVALSIYLCRVWSSTWSASESAQVQVTASACWAGNLLVHLNMINNAVEFWKIS